MHRMIKQRPRQPGSRHAKLRRIFGASHRTAAHVTPASQVLSLQLKMKTALLLSGAALVGATTWDQLATSEYTYEAWLAEYQPKHAGSREVFEANLAEIRAHNANPKNTWKMGVNKVREASAPAGTPAALGCAMRL